MNHSMIIYQIIVLFIIVFLISNMLEHFWTTCSINHVKYYPSKI